MFGMKDMQTVVAVVPVTITTTTTHAYIDIGTMGGFNKRGVKFVWNLGGVAGTTPSITCTVLECATTNGTYAAPVQIDAPSAATTNGYVECTIYPTYRYVEAKTTFTSNTTSAIVSVTAHSFSKVNNG